MKMSRDYILSERVGFESQSTTARGGVAQKSSRILCVTKSHPLRHSRYNNECVLRPWPPFLFGIHTTLFRGIAHARIMGSGSESDV